MMSFIVLIWLIPGINEVAVECVPVLNEPSKRQVFVLQPNGRWAERPEGQFKEAVTYCEARLQLSNTVRPSDPFPEPQ